MLCPNCGTICSEHINTCTECGFCFNTSKSSQERKKQSIDEDQSNESIKYVAEEINKEEYIYIKPDARWIGPRRTVHILCIIMGCLAARYGYILATLTGLFLDDMSDEGAYCFLFGLVQITLGVVGLVKIRSRTCCGVIAIIHLFIVLPFVKYRDIFSTPGSDIQIAVFVSLVTMALSFSTLYKDEGVVSGWICLVVYVALAIFMCTYMKGENKQTFLTNNNAVICAENESINVIPNDVRGEKLWLT